jgi:hypothetical protein
MMDVYSHQTIPDRVTRHLPSVFETLRLGFRHTSLPRKLSWRIVCRKGTFHTGGQRLTSLLCQYDNQIGPDSMEQYCVNVLGMYTQNQDGMEEKRETYQD